MDSYTANVIRIMGKKIEDLEARVERLEKELKREKFINLPNTMTLLEQAKALEEHKDTPMTYSEIS